MKISSSQIEEANKKGLKGHMEQYNHLAGTLSNKGVDVEVLIRKLAAFQVAIPSWALGAGGTRFGRFSFHGEPGSLEQKIEDVGLLHSLTSSAGAISLHIPWDMPRDYQAIRELAAANNLLFDAVNSNTFQDRKEDPESYRYGSLSSTDSSVRKQAIAHNVEVIETGVNLGSKSLTVWLADGSNFPGQSNFQSALRHTAESLREIYSAMPEDWKLFIEYKPYEPNFYSTVIQDWGTSYMLANECGERAFTLVDLGHHLPNTNIEQIVATLMMKGRLGGFHFNDSKYGDDDLTVGSVKPYALFLIFNELVQGMENNPQNPYPSWMIDASHNIKDPLEDLMQSLEAIREAYAKALLIDQEALNQAQETHDVAMCQELLQDAFRTDVRPLLQKARLERDAALDPIKTYRQLRVRENLVSERGTQTVASGL